MGYSGITILQFFAQLQKWFVISNGDKLKIREYFHAPWTDTPDAHASMYAAQLDERQLKCVNFEVVILDAAKTIFFVSQMDKSGLFESKFIGNYDDEANKLLTTTGTIFVKQYNREMRRIKREAENKDYKIMAAIRRVSRRKNLGNPVPQTTADVTAQEYIAALEEKAVMQDAYIKDIMARNPPATVPATDVAAATRTITRGTIRSSKNITQITELQSSLAAMMKTVTTQAAGMTSLTK